MSSEAQQAKAAGAAAWSAGQFADAVEHFTAAINHGGDKEFLKVLYSNRSAALLKLNRLDDALRDGCKCVELDSQWAKGYVRKGDVLYALRRYTEAYNAYNSGLRNSPNDASIQEKAEMAMRAIRNESTSSTSSSSTTSSSDASPFDRYIRIAILLLGFVYLIPFLPHFISTNSYRLSAGLYGGSHMQGLFRRCGFPKFSSEYVARIAQDASVVRIFLGFMLVFSPRPYIFCILPILLSEGAHYAKDILEYARNNISTIEQSVLPLLSRFFPQASRMNLAAMFAPQHAGQAALVMHRLAASCEVYQGVFHVVELFLPTRNFLQLYLWWQYLKLRYMADQQGYVKFAFQDLDRNLSSLLSHQYCPAVVRQGYAMVKGFLAKQVQPPTPAAAQAGAGGGIGSMLSKCSIM